MFSPNICLQCQKPLVGRSDKKFCDIHCKALFNNAKSRSKDAALHKTNSILRKNRSILRELSPEGKATVRKTALEDRHFSFHIFTTFWKSKNGVYFFSYEWGFMPIIDHKGIQKAVIIQMQNYMRFDEFDPWARLGGRRPK